MWHLLSQSFHLQILHASLARFEGYYCPISSVRRKPPWPWFNLLHEKSRAFLFNRSSRKTVFSHHSHTVCDYNQATERPRRVVAVWSAKRTSEHAPGVALKKIAEILLYTRSAHSLPLSSKSRIPKISKWLKFRIKCTSRRPICGSGLFLTSNDDADAY
ncbi:hypothetical protein EVAR_82681_1 [Eumeta japonica]|uniref:Uncharacterized protein n=1 Tax=Eumeta variegata TaxID=151549 RepID=A0A4C1VAM2_EUMVA|nr:hypothetical protein EVAR_82681_1 [Eumeta japonica]